MLQTCQILGLICYENKEEVFDLKKVFRSERKRVEEEASEACEVSVEEREI